MTQLRSSLGPALVVGLVATAVYLPSLSNGLAWDDERDIRDNPVIVGAEGPADVLLSPYRGGVPPQRSPYRPVTSLTYWLNAQAEGGDAAAFHMVNVALHGVGSALVTVLLATLGVGGGGALIGGLLFAVHPVHVEAVANVVGRADVLMTVFCLLGALAYLSRSLGNGARAVAVALAYALALGAKENGVVLPALLVVLLWARTGGRGPDDVPLSKAGRRRMLRDEALVLSPTALVLAGYLVLRSHVIDALVHRDTAPYIALLAPGERVSTAIANLAHLARLLLWPADLAADYGPDVIVVSGVDTLAFWVGVLVAGLAVALIVALLRRERLAAAAVAWATLSVLIVSNLVVPIGIWIAERTLYLPSVAVSIGAAAAIAMVRQRAPTRLPVAWMTAGLLVGAGTWKTLDRIPVWQDSESVLVSLTEDHPESYRSQWWLAQRLAEVNDYPASLRWYEQARATNPNDLGLALDHARTLLLAGRPAEAEALAASLPPTDPERFVYLAQSRIMTGRTEEAAEDVRQGLERFPMDERLRGQAAELGIQPD